MVSTSTTILAAIALTAAAAPTATAFAPVSTNNAAARPLYAASEDASAQALSDYMAKSHEEKLRAVKDVEDKKNGEIAALKAEIGQLKTSGALATTAPAAAPTSNLALSEMEAKLASYQNFMAEYIVNAQNQKLLAVKEAELNAEKKFEGRLNKLLEASGMALPASEAAPAAAAAVVVESSFDKRNAQIIAAGAKSRWGSMEIERASEQAKSAPVAVAVTSAPQEVGATVFQQRNAQVAAAGAAGKSRWGNMEVNKASAGGSVATAPAPAAVAVAEKKEVTLEDRLNLGARLLGA